MGRPSLEVADVIVAHAAGLLARGGVTSARRRVLVDLAACRTSALGGHADECQSCGHARVSYNSCRNRHCPKCQGSRRAAWVEAQEARLLPVPYFHVVFTLPAQIAEIALQNKRELYGLLFRASAETLQQVARDPRHLGGEIGFVSLLHTWSQTLQHHPHVHVIVAGGGLSADGARWVACRPGFFLPVRVLGRVFRGKFLAGLEALRRQGRLRWQGRLEDLRDDRAWRQRQREARRLEWVVYAKSPFGGVDCALRYLARYTHRVAISNERLLSLHDGVVAFRYRDSAHGNRARTMRLDAQEFLRRFLLHVLPKGFPKLRSYGFLANRSCKLDRCRELLGVEADPGVRADESSAADEVERRCPTCGGREIVRKDLPKRSEATEHLRVAQAKRLDTS
ncbi:MAG: IS91 family transposase [Planctomycetes bacterium]|nr:IS91 family transposase [Planctomycetota bacterium]